jgi:OmpA-OmpF porin, OOP family
LKYDSLNLKAKLIASFASITLVMISAVVPTHSSLAVEIEDDHFLVTPYEGSTLRRKNFREFDQYQAFMGIDEATGEPKGLALEGKLTKLYYSQPKDRSIYEIFENYKQALTEGGAVILYQCDQRKYECAKNYAKPTLQKFSGINSISNLVGSYLLARLETAGKVAYIAIAVGQQFTDVHVIELTEMDEGKVSLDASALASGIDANGYVIVKGIYFDTNKAVVKATSNKALAQVTKLLNSRPDMKIYIVGHTDMQGALDFNMQLSQQRAKAVLKTLAEQFNINPERMQAHGLGPLSPQATNSTADGRSQNRRVVIVRR